MKKLKSVILLYKDLKSKSQESVFHNEENKVLNIVLLEVFIIVQILYIKNPSEYNDTLYDLIEMIDISLSKKDVSSDQKFSTVFTEICLQLISNGSQSMIDFIIKEFKKVSTYLNEGSINVLVGFLKM